VSHYCSERRQSAYSLREPFSGAVIAAVEVGEESGKLPEMFDQLSDFYKRQQKLKGAIMKSIMMPGITLVMSFFVLLYVLYGILPQITSIFIDMGLELPAAIKALMGLADFLQKYGIILCVLGVIGYKAFKKLIKIGV